MIALENSVEFFITITRSASASFPFLGMPHICALIHQSAYGIFLLVFKSKTEATAVSCYSPLFLRLRAPSFRVGGGGHIHLLRSASQKAWTPFSSKHVQITNVFVGKISLPHAPPYPSTNGEGLYGNCFLS